MREYRLFFAIFEEARLVEVAAGGNFYDAEVDSKKIKASTDDRAIQKADRAIKKAVGVWEGGTSTLSFVPIFLSQWNRKVKDYPLPEKVSQKLKLVAMRISSAIT